MDTELSGQLVDRLPLAVAVQQFVTPIWAQPSLDLRSGN
jgi:hypothetical protein